MPFVMDFTIQKNQRYAGSFGAEKVSSGQSGSNLYFIGRFSYSYSNCLIGKGSVCFYLKTFFDLTIT